MTKKAFYFLEDFELRSKESKAINYVAKCPECEKWNLRISKASGLYNCFTAGCEFKGIVQDFVPAKPLIEDSDANGSFYPKGNRLRYVSASPMKHPPGPLHKGDAGVRMLPTDYKRLKPETLADIKPVTANEVSNDLDEQAVWLYLSEMGISR